MDFLSVYQYGTLVQLSYLEDITIKVFPSFAMLVRIGLITVNLICVSAESHPSVYTAHV